MVSFGFNHVINYVKLGTSESYIKNLSKKYKSKTNPNYLIKIQNIQRLHDT